MVKLKKVNEDANIEEIADNSNFDQDAILALLKKPPRHIFRNINELDDDIDSAITSIEDGEKCYSFSEFKKLFNK